MRRKRGREAYLHNQCWCLVKPKTLWSIQLKKKDPIFWFKDATCEAERQCSGYELKEAIVYICTQVISPA